MTMASVLWVGAPGALGAQGVADAPSCEIAWARSVEEAIELPLAAFDATVLDLPDAGVLQEALARLAEADSPPVCVRLYAPDAGLEAALRAGGARAVVVAPHDESGSAVLGAALRALAPLRPAPARSERRGAGQGHSPRGIVGQSAVMRSLYELLERAMHSQATVLLTGETGTGKEVLARAIHDGGPRSRGPFIAVNCAAFPDSLLESELFGHAKGAFTGADRAKAGLFAEASGGTLFLDEVGETSPPLQAKLLRVLQEREVRPLGGARPRRVDVRLVAATNRDLRHEVASGRLREDLYYRLAVFLLAVPPLRERREDILPLAEHFLARHGAREGKPGCRLSPEAADLLLAHPWPGNVRELENEMQRALALADAGEPILPGHLSERVRDALEPVAAAARVGETLRETMARIEAWLVRRALAAHGGRRAATARTLGLTREGLYKKMRRYGIE